MTTLPFKLRPALGSPEGALVLLHGRGADELDFPVLHEPGENIRRSQKGFSRPQDIFGQAPAWLLGLIGLVNLIHKIGEAQEIFALVVESDVEVFRGHQIGDDPVNGLEEVLQGV